MAAIFYMKDYVPFDRDRIQRSRYGAKMERTQEGVTFLLLGSKSHLSIPI